nr:oligosaccharide flippase family protein [uncultured Methanospirillum sp.]
MSENTSLDIKFSERLSINVITNIIQFGLNFIIGLWLVPYFVDTLGIAAYGLIPLATSITCYVTLVIDSLNSSISRFLTIDLQRSDIIRANITFNTALFGSLGIITILIPIVIIISLFAPVFFHVGKTPSGEVIILFLLILGSVLIRAWSSNFMVTLFAYNRFDYRNIVTISNSLIQLFLVIFLFTAFTPSLIFVGISYFIAAITSLFIAISFSRKVCSGLKISPKHFSKETFIEIWGIAFWVIVDTIGFMLNANIALIVVNRLFGDIASSEYSLVLQWSTLLIGISGLVISAMTPMIFNYYSKNDSVGLIQFSLFAMKCVGLFMTPIIGLICLFSSQLFTLWMGSDEYTHLTPLMWIIICPIIIRIQTSAISSVGVGYGKVKIPAFYSLFAGIVNLSFSFTLPFLFGLGIYGVAISSALSIIIHTGISAPIYVAYLLHAPLFIFCKRIICGIGYLGGFLIIGTFTLYFISTTSLFISIILGLSLTFVYVIIMLTCLLNKTEKLQILFCLPPIIKNNTPLWIIEVNFKSHFIRDMINLT